MRLATLGFAAAVAALAAAARPAERQIIGAEQDHSLASESDDCTHFFNTTFTSFRDEVHDQEQREIDLSGVDQLRVVATTQGGVSIRGWSKPNARLIVCRYAVSNDRARATRLLGAIHVSHAQGEIAAYGPPADEAQAWWVNMILYVPRRATVDVRAENGGVAIRNMSGRVTAKSGSGGISVAQSRGRYRISTETGGITLDRVAGDVEAVSREGAIALKLPSSELPAIEAKTADAGHIHCTLKSCEEATWGANRQVFRLGEGLPHIRLSTTGGAITIAPSL